MRAWVIPAAALAALALVTAGCGGAAAGPSAPALGGGAAVAPADSVVFVAVDTSATSGQWEAAQTLLGKISSKDDLLKLLRSSFEQKTKLSFDDDVRPALGSEVDLAVLPGEKPQVVCYLQPSSKDKLDALLAKSDQKLVSRQVDGWTAVAESDAILDTAAAATTKLDQSSVYQAAQAKLDGEALVRAYANAQKAQQLLKNVASGAATLGTGLQYTWAAADLSAGADGLVAHVVAHPDGSTPNPASYVPALLDEIPAGVLAAVDFRVGDDGVPLGKLPSVGPAAMFAGALKDVLGGETALYVRPGLPIPEVTLVTHPADTAKASAALDSLLSTVKNGSSGGGGFNLGNLPIQHAVHGDELIVSTSQQGIGELEGTGPKLSTDGTFREAKDASGLPDSTTGLVYLNVKDSLPLVQTFAPLAGVKLPAPLQGQSLQALRTVTAFGTSSGGDLSVTIFVEVR